MKTRHFLLFWLLVFMGNPATALVSFQQEFKQFQGRVVNEKNGDPLSGAAVVVAQNNISTITNEEGDFSIKVPVSSPEFVIRISHLGYQSVSLSSSSFSEGVQIIGLQENAEELSEVNILTYDDPVALVKKMLSNRVENYLDTATVMTAFYRESISRGRRPVSLSEAVVKIFKQPYRSLKDEEIALIKARKTADYTRLDTLALKLRGGPFNPLSVDLVKNPTSIFYDQPLENFSFSFAEPVSTDGKVIYAVAFEELFKDRPWYQGVLYIDPVSFSLVEASFSLDVENRDLASDLFVKKKPGGTRVYPVRVQYKVQYRQKASKWYYGYGQTELELVVNWKRKLFNSRYTVKSELAVTDWEYADNSARRGLEFLSPRVVMNDDISGFQDLTFWGRDNIIEPDKSIENAIEKIRDRLQE